MPDSGSAIRVNVVLRDALQAERLKAFARRLPDFRLQITAEPLAEDARVDVYVLPEDLLPAAAGPDPPTIFYGSPRSLRRAYLAGCADFLKEPWDPEELECRVRRLLQRRQEAFTFSWGEARLREQVFACPAGQAALSYQEERILRALILRRTQPVPREALHYAIWGKQPDRRSRVVDVHVSRLRRKLAPLLPEGERCIETVRRVGYRFSSR